MKYLVQVEIPNSSNILLELNDINSPNTVKEFVNCMPFLVNLNIWGEEIYTNESPIRVPEENSTSTVNLNDVAYWPPGKAICLFFGSTPIGKKGEITPASPVNVIGKILSPGKDILLDVDGKSANFKLKS